MSTATLTLITYVWHYVVARLAYDQVIRPLSHGHLSVTLVICAVALAAFLLGRWTGRANRREA